MDVYLDLFPGCNTSTSGWDNCTRKQALTNPKFKLKGDSYKVVGIAQYPTNDRLGMAFDGLTGAEAKAALSGAELHVDGYMLAFSDAQASNNDLFFESFEPDSDWTEGQKVRLYLTVPPPPERVTGLKAVPMDKAVLLTWDDLSSVPQWGWISTMQYRKRGKTSDGWGNWGDWTDMGLVGSYTVNGLLNGTSTQFVVRATGPGGDGKPSRPAAAKPNAKPARPTGLIASAAGSAVILHWDTHPDYSTWEDDNAKWQYRVGEGKWQLVAERGANGNIVKDSKGKAVPAVDPSSFTVTGLANGTEYTFKVRARNDAGWGKPSATVSATPAAPPGPAARGDRAPILGLHPHRRQPAGTGREVPPAVRHPGRAPGHLHRHQLVQQAGAERSAQNFQLLRCPVPGDHLHRGGQRPGQHRQRHGRAGLLGRRRVDHRHVGRRRPVRGRVGRQGIPAMRPGRKKAAPQVWTGSNRSGNAWSYPSLRYYAGAPNVWVGSPQALDHRGDPIGTGAMSYPTWGSTRKPPANSTELPLYGISPVITISKTEVWTATLEGSMRDGEVGCDNGSTHFNDCSDANFLTDDDFTQNGVTYTVKALRRNGARSPGLAALSGWNSRAISAESERRWGSIR